MAHGIEQANLRRQCGLEHIFIVTPCCLGRYLRVFELNLFDEAIGFAEYGSEHAIEVSLRGGRSNPKRARRSKKNDASASIFTTNAPRLGKKMRTHLLRAASL